MRKEVQSYREAAAGSSEQSDQALLDEIAHLQLAAGMTDVVGPGIEGVLEDSTAANISGDEADYLIHDSDILSVVNELRDAGAEALSSTATVFLPRRRSAAAGRWSPSTDGAPARPLSLMPSVTRIPCLMR